MPRHDPVDYAHYHYVFLTDTLEKAQLYSLYTAALDNHINNKTNEEPIGVVFYISTKGLKNIERDPEEVKIMRHLWPKEKWLSLIHI